MSEASQPTRKWTVVAAALVVIGVALRLAYPAYVSFGGEQVESVALAWQSWREGGTDHGLRVSIGIDMPPFYLWVLSLPVAITRDPVRVTQFVMFLNLAGLVGLFFLVRARRSTAEAWLVTALIATAPWSIAFARKVWAQDILFPFAVAFYAVFLSALDQPAPWKTWMSFLLLGVVAQIYPAAWFLIPPILLTAWLARLQIRWRDAAIGVLLVLILWWPYIHHEIAVDFDDWRYLRAMMFGGEHASVVEGADGASRGLFSQLVGVWQRSGGTGLDALLGQDAYAGWQSGTIARVSTWISTVFLGACAAASVYALWTLAREMRARVFAAEPMSPTLTLFAAILLGVPIEYAILGLPTLAHYQIVVQPAAAILVVALVSELARRFESRGDAFQLATVGGFALVHAVQSASLQSYVVERPATILSGNGPILVGVRAQMDRQLAKALDDVEFGDARRAAENARLAALFASSSDVLLSYSGTTGEPALKPFGGITLEPGPEGTVATLRVPPAQVDLPDFPVRERGQVIVRIDMTSPIDAYQTVFFQTEAHREYLRTQMIVQKLPRGRSERYVALAAPGLRGPLRLWLGATRSTIHSIEVRAVDGAQSAQGK